jgi:hypothetical protein
MTIEFDPDATPIAGRVEQEDRAPQDFEGILELVALVEAARTPVDGGPGARS